MRVSASSLFMSDTESGAPIVTRTPPPAECENARTIRERLKDSVLLEGKHYIRPFGGRKILYMWESIEHDMGIASNDPLQAIPMANGAACHG